ncbi:uncharacterized protein LOC127011073 [Drosophila biarmipes]|uniref:uncharacterized protein LOC127011073 n=1 Tax=Drosophila biarmipes TaxID=125945 RepID=UPI0021CC5C6A|nr:uncharacterized protein LOC127011073 [Drosophila biarmipes]
MDCDDSPPTPPSTPAEPSAAALTPIGTMTATCSRASNFLLKLTAIGTKRHLAALTWPEQKLSGSRVSNYQFQFRDPRINPTRCLEVRTVFVSVSVSASACESG